MAEIHKLWKKYNICAHMLSEALGRTNNIVGEYAEHLALSYYGGDLLATSNGGADLKCLNGKLYQVKSRKLSAKSCTQLGIIRSWSFDFLVVILFDTKGNVSTGLEFPVDVAKEYAVKNKHQNGWVISTTKSFLEDPRARIIKKYLK